MGKLRTKESEFFASGVKAKLLYAGLQLLNRYGYGGLSISALGKESGLTKQNVYYHFPDTDAVLLALADVWDKSGIQVTLEKLALAKGSGARKVIAMAEGMFDWMRQYPEITRLTLVLFQSEAYIPQLRSVMGAAKEIGRNRIASFLEEEPRFMRLTPAKRQEVVLQLHSSLYGFFFYAIVMNEYPHLDNYERACLNGLEEKLHLLLSAR